MKQGRIALTLLSITFLLNGCFTPRTGGAKRLLGLIPIPGTGTTEILTEGDPSYVWMFQLLAVGTLGLVIISSWISRRITKFGIVLSGTAFAISAWGLIMPTIQRTASMYIPWIVGGVLAIGCVDVFFRFKSKLNWKIGKVPKTVQQTGQQDNAL